MADYEHLRGDLWTPITPEVVAVLELAKEEFGSWRQLSLQAGYRDRVIRRYRHGSKRYPSRRRRAMPLKIMDAILTKANLPHKLEDFPWYTVDELVERGIWKPQAHYQGRKLRGKS